MKNRHYWSIIIVSCIYSFFTLLYRIYYVNQSYSDYMVGVTLIVIPFVIVYYIVMFFSDRHLKALKKSDGKTEEKT